MGKELPSVSNGLVDRIMSFDRYSGENSRVSQAAYYLYLKRLRLGIPGSPEEDWEKAEKLVEGRIVRHLNQKLAQSQAI